MTSRLVALGLGLLACAAVGASGDLAPGLWELSLSAKVPAEPGFDPGSFTVTQCLTAGDAANPSKILGPLTTPSSGQCSFANTSYAGGNLRFSMVCNGTLGLKTTGEVSYSATTMHGELTTSSTIDGKSVEFKSVISGHRLSDC